MKSSSLARTSACDPPGRRLAADGYLPLPVETIDARRRGSRLDADHLIQTHRTAFVRGDRQQRQRVGAGAELLRGAQPHIVLFASRGEAGDHLAGDHGVQSGGDIGYAHAQVGRALAVDFDAQLRLAVNQRRIRVHHVGQGLEPGQQLLRVLRELVQIRTADRVLDVARPAPALYADTGSQIGRIILEDVPRLDHHVLLRFAALIIGNQLDVDGTGIGGAIRAAADRSQGRDHVRHRADVAGDSFHDIGSGRQRGSFRRPDRDQILRAIVHRREAFPDH